MDSGIDHLYEATQHVRATPLNPQDHFQRAQAHALVDIAKSLRKLVHQGRTPRTAVEYNIRGPL